MPAGCQRVVPASVIQHPHQPPAAVVRVYSSLNATMWSTLVTRLAGGNAGDPCRSASDDTFLRSAPNAIRMRISRCRFGDEMGSESLY